MGKKVDLNKRPETGNTVKKHNNSTHPNITADTNKDNDSLPNTQPPSNDLKAKVIEEGLKKYGVPSSIAKAASQNERVQNAVTTPGIMKMPIKNSITFYAITIFLVVFCALMLYVTLFGNNDKGISSISAIYQECSSITVIETDCDEFGNCSNKYSGKVSFEDYIAGVIGAETQDNSYPLEYYKVLSIITRTELLNNLDSSCEVEGNSSFKEYIPIEESSNRELINKAVEETSGKLLIQDEMLMESYSTTACLVNEDSTDYYVRFGSAILEDTKVHKVPKEWASTSVYNNLLEDLSSQISQTGDNFSKECPPGTDDYGISLIGALYLIDGVKYTSDEVLKYYYGDEIEIKSASSLTSELVNGFINPVSTINCTSAYGSRIHPTTGTQSFHSGIDIGIAGGTPIYAVKSGVISRIVSDVTAINSKTSSNLNGFGYGNNIIIDHGDGTSTLYAHMKYGSIPSSLNVGDEVSQGEQIGEVGTTGVSTGNHLHYEVKVNGKAVDPADYMDLSTATGQCRR